MSLFLLIVRRGAAVAFSYREREAPARELEAAIAQAGGRAIALAFPLRVGAGYSSIPRILERIFAELLGP